MEEMQEMNLRSTSCGLEYQLEKAERIGADDEIKREIAEKLYEHARKEENYDRALELAEKYLKLSEVSLLALKENRFRHMVIRNWSCGDEEFEKPYAERVKEAVEGITEERVMKIIQKSYDYLMTKQPDIKPEHQCYTITASWFNTSFDGCVFTDEAKYEDETNTHISWSDHRTIFVDPRLWKVVLHKINE
jgi:hypothetical protein